jgi:hypothetical protein
VSFEALDFILGFKVENISQVKGFAVGKKTMID